MKRTARSENQASLLKAMQACLHDFRAPIQGTVCLHRWVRHVLQLCSRRVAPLFIVSTATQFMTVRVQEMRNLLQWETSCDVETVRIHMFILGKKSIRTGPSFIYFEFFHLGCQSYSVYLNIFNLLGVKCIPSIISLTLQRRSADRFI